MIRRVSKQIFYFVSWWKKDEEMIHLVYVQFFEAFDFLKRLLSDQKQISLPVSLKLAYWEELASKNMRQSL